MYNRYIPQPDGSYRRRPVQEPQRAAPKSCQPAPQKGACPVPEAPAAPPKPKPRQQPRQDCDAPAGSFLRQLLPKDFDTGDLIVILLLLLMAGDCEEDRNNALLTIALYFMM